MAYILLTLSVLLSTARNLLSKNLSGIHFGSRAFFWCQSILFLFGTIAVIIFSGFSITVISYITLSLALVYGLLLILAQWFYTASLAKGNTALCSTVYSLGFILPTLSGAIFWSESFSLLDLLGVLCAAAAVCISGLKSQAKGETKNIYYW